MHVRRDAITHHTAILQACNRVVLLSAVVILISCCIRAANHVITDTRYLLSPVPALSHTARLRFVSRRELWVVATACIPPLYRSHAQHPTIIVACCSFLLQSVTT